MSTSAKAGGAMVLGEVDPASLERLVATASDVAFVLDGRGQVLEVLATDRDLLRGGLREWRGKALVEIVNGESQDKVGELLRDALAQPPVPSAWRHVNLVLRGNEDLPFLFSVAPARLNRRQPELTRLVAFGRDLRPTTTLQRRVVEAQRSLERDYARFRDAETRFRTLFQTSQEPTLAVDATTLRVTDANDAALALLRTDASRLNGTPLLDLFSGSVAGALQERLAAARSIGKHEPIGVTLGRGGQALTLGATYVRQEPAGMFIVRLLPVPMMAGRGRRSAAASGTEGAGRQGSEAAMLSAFMRHTSDALVFADSQGRILAANRAFAQLSQLSSEEQAVGQALDRWLGRQGVEVGVLITNLRDTGTVGLYTTELRGEVGGVTEVEVSASRLQDAGNAAYGFVIRDTATRLRPQVAERPDVAPSVRQLAELVGRVPLKQIVAETSDLIEQMSIEAALQMARDNRALAAQLLGLSRQSLYVKLRRFGLGDLPGSAEAE